MHLSEFGHCCVESMQQIKEELQQLNNHIMAEMHKRKGRHAHSFLCIKMVINQYCDRCKHLLFLTNEADELSLATAV